MIKITCFSSKIPSGRVKISKNSSYDTIFRQILDFCDAKTAICTIPNDLEIECRDAKLKEIIINGLNHIFQNIECKNEFIEFYEKRSITAKDKAVRWCD